MQIKIINVEHVETAEIPTCSRESKVPSLVVIHVHVYNIMKQPQLCLSISVEKKPSKLIDKKILKFTE